MKHWKHLGIPDEKLTEELSGYAPGDTDTMERIFAKSEAKFHKMQDTPAEEETYKVERDQPRYIRRVMAGLAACAVVGIGGWGLWKLSQHTPHTPPTTVPISPEQSVDTGAALLEKWDRCTPVFHLQYTGEQAEVAEPKRLQFRDILARQDWTEVTPQEEWGDAARPDTVPMPETAVQDTVSVDLDEDRLFITKDGKVSWYDIYDGDQVHLHLYRISAEDAQRLYDLVYGSDSTAPFLEAIDAALANGYDLQFYGNSDEEGYPVLSDTQINQFRALMDTVDWTETEGQNTENDCIKLVIPAENAENYQTVYFYPEWIYYSESPASSFLHIYAAPEGLYDALRTTIFTENVTAVPETVSITLTAQNVTPDGLTLVLDTTEPIPADTILYGKEFSLWELKDDEWVRVPQFNEDAAFTSEGYPFTQRTELAVDWNWIYGTLSQGHYRIGKHFTDSRRTGDSTDYELYAEFDITPEMAGTPVGELPFSINQFRNDLMFMMVPAYAPNLFSVTGLQERLADAMERSVWIEAEPTLRDGESALLYVCGVKKGKHYALEFDHLGYVYVHFGDGETTADCTPTKCYRISAELTLAAQQLASKPTTEAKNGLDPTKGMFHYEPQGGNAVNEVWEQMDDMAQQADMSAYEEVIRDHNQRHGDHVSLLTREECEELGISYFYYLWEITRKTS
ncbi:MAG: hypothetical protein II916_04645 [Oscillospiraceae bacterium]|nr:hypothetical protein [Oscillospiraceae bacterium]